VVCDDLAMANYLVVPKVQNKFQFFLKIPQIPGNSSQIPSGTTSVEGQSRFGGIIPRCPLCRQGPSLLPPILSSLLLPSIKGKINAKNQSKLFYLVFYSQPKLE
jgi:hypothetical protein